MHIVISEGPERGSAEVSPNITLELDENREIIGIEILEASKVVEHVPEYIEDLKDEARWNSSFAKTQDKLVAAARQVRKEIEEGYSTPLDIEEL